MSYDRDEPATIRRSAPFSRRALLGGAAAGAVAAALPAASITANSRSVEGSESLVAPDGGYAKAPLSKDRVQVSVVQSALLAVDASSPEQRLRENLNRMLEQIDATHGYFGRKDLVCFHEFLLQGWDRWDKGQLERIAIDIPGWQTEAIAKKCREYSCYISFGGYCRDPDWPGHIIDMMVLMNPKGEIIAKHWKARNLRRLMPHADYFTTAVYDVLDQYREMYGEDAVIPVARTEIGNICMTSVHREPELYRCMAMKGCEILVRSGLGGYTMEDAVATARYNSLYVLFASNALSPGNRGYFPDNGMLGDSAIYDLRGNRMHSVTVHEAAVNATLEMGRLRARPVQPDMYWDLYRPVYEQYVSRFPPNIYEQRLPVSLSDSSDLHLENLRWGS